MIDFLEQKNYQEGLPDYLFMMHHGLGATANDFIDLPAALGFMGAGLIGTEGQKKFKFLFPQAIDQSVTINGGMSMPSWYDITSMDFEREVNPESLQVSIDLLLEIVEQEMSHGLQVNQLVLAGFSQGGAISATLCQELFQKYGDEGRIKGLVMLSSYIIDTEKFIETVPADLPVFIGHGNLDPVVPFELGQKYSKELVDNGFSINWQEYPIPHSVSNEEIADLKVWLNKLTD